jgi:hypothetical protein
LRFIATAPHALESLGSILASSMGVGFQTFMPVGSNLVVPTSTIYQEGHCVSSGMGVVAGAGVWTASVHMCLLSTSSGSGSDP